MKKNSNRKSSVSKARTYKAMGNFWDTHDLSDFWNKTRPARASVRLESEESFYAIEKALSQTILRAAKERGVSPHTLVNLWLQEKIQRLKLSSGRG
jgi:hypothetical protein